MSVLYHHQEGKKGHQYSTALGWWKRGCCNGFSALLIKSFANRSGNGSSNVFSNAKASSGEFSNSIVKEVGGMFIGRNGRGQCESGDLNLCDQAGFKSSSPSKKLPVQNDVPKAKGVVANAGGNSVGGEVDSKYGPWILINYGKGRFKNSWKRRGLHNSFKSNVGKVQDTRFIKPGVSSGGVADALGVKGSILDEVAVIIDKAPDIPSYGINVDTREVSS
ncbi:hypothetical protein MA16_Dca008957 [Dendrobium catenatum]|uniref:Uncharacterized protein n=1 Tax=Dendrobium catenatum TaxID=906689 RepID=A0A2I0WRN6_9ASPA|nr:hypothetical protein MA16_Dca008957 [Dendrobium catenatum]